MLRCIQRKETDPHFNLAAEEYLLQHATMDTFMVWKNDPCVIVGKHQNTAREINHALINHEGIPVIRRITGGGTVYHDRGNINFSFIRLNRKENPVDYKFFTHPVIIFLKSMGLDAVFEGKSNISIDGLKISGNSAHVFKGRVLHHGTLLYDSDLEFLENVIASGEERYDDRAVKSVRKKVSNIASHIKAEMKVDDFMESFFSFIINYYEDAYNDSMKNSEYQAISKLAGEKYHDPQWNFGYSPDYMYSTRWNSDEGIFTLKLNAKEGHIYSIQVLGPPEHSEFLKAVEGILTGILHERESVINVLKNFNFASEKQTRVINQIIDHLF